MAKLEKIKNHSNLYKDKDSNIIYYRKRSGGILLEFSTGETGLNRAKRFIETRLEQLRVTRKKGLKSLKPNASFETLWGSFIEHKISKGLTKKTISVNQNQWNSALSLYFGSKNIHDLNIGLLTSFEAWYLKRFPERIYFNCKKTLREFLSYIKSKGFETPDYELRDLDLIIKSNKKHEKVGRVYTKKEISALLKHSDDTTYLGVTLACYLGLRKKEFLSIELKNIVKNKIKVWSFKNKKWRTIPVPQDILDSIHSYVSSRESTKFVFESKNRAGEIIPMHSQVFDKGWVDAKAAANIKDHDKPLKARVHDLRHTCATNFAQSSMPIAVSCSILDMSIDIFEKVYVHVTEESKEEWINEIYKIEWGISGE